MGYYVYEHVHAISMGRCDNLDILVKENHELITVNQTIANGYYFYSLLWDGSKEGWECSDEADILRKLFIEACRSCGSIVHAVHVLQGEDSDNPIVNNIIMMTPLRSKI